MWRSVKLTECDVPIKNTVEVASKAMKHWVWCDVKLPDAIPTVVYNAWKMEYTINLALMSNLYPFIPHG